MPHERKPLHVFPFLEGNDRFGGQVEVVHRTTSYEDGNTRRFIDLTLKIGERFLNLPIRQLDDVIAQLLKARDVASEELQKLLAEQPREQRTRGGPRTQSRPRNRNRED
jgi:hypothetical protein